ncbi:hypothetical protein F2Q69_00037825 [Brassica cretica]|uniref:Uncharacterized protein n=2 Tax=Brassica cretica TaxID=69181 RepID=A0A3N6TV95_BRACR|nr:hypothetical protein DY000_02042288 [Brassica cretica]KAF3602788.1 hypothetical protein F2Q69_00037825 [Brassica cretica]
MPSSLGSGLLHGFKGTVILSENQLLNALRTLLQRNGRPSYQKNARLSIGSTQKVENSGLVGYSRIFEVDVHESPVLFTLRKSNGAFNDLVLV